MKEGRKREKGLEGGYVCVWGGGKEGATRYQQGWVIMFFTSGQTGNQALVTFFFCKVAPFFCSG